MLAFSSLVVDYSTRRLWIVAASFTSAQVCRNPRPRRSATDTESPCRLAYWNPHRRLLPAFSDPIRPWCLSGIPGCSYSSTISSAHLKQKPSVRISNSQCSTPNQHVIAMRATQINNSWFERALSNCNKNLTPQKKHIQVSESSCPLREQMHWFPLIEFGIRFSPATHVRWCDTQATAGGSRSPLHPDTGEIPSIPSWTRSEILRPRRRGGTRALRLCNWVRGSGTGSRRARESCCCTAGPNVMEKPILSASGKGRWE